MSEHRHIDLGHVYYIYGHIHQYLYIYINEHDEMANCCDEENIVTKHRVFSKNSVHIRQTLLRVGDF